MGCGWVIAASVANTANMLKAELKAGDKSVSKTI